ncbi:MAG: fused MFS/spermidine synthase [Gammaproteobacteria bacterium]|nr:fused MFS/spermidine synthase [Gammaproteobacteria bacterium]MDH5651667.1 fused MFS/spermidine synthase [Gammaproteobacteria bacterium]
MTQHRRTLAWYGAVVFLSSALLMILEIVAGRIIAPYVGVSLYTWSSVIGVVLGGLSLGNWLGGRWADQGAGEWQTGLVLLAAGLSGLAVLFLLTVLAPVLQGLAINLLGASFLYVLCLFFLPSVLLGVVTPLLTTMAITLDTRAGHIVGRMNALAALGSILGTFLAGFWLIQYAGTRLIVISVAVMLCILALPFLRQRFIKPLAVMVIVAGSMIGITAMRSGFDEPCDEESAYFCIRVVNAWDMTPFGEARALVLDHLVHGINHAADPTLLVSPYMHLMDELIRLHLGSTAPQAKYFFSGGGAYTHPRAVRAALPTASITVAELDEAVTRIAVQRMYVDISGMQIIHNDARIALQRLAGEKYDAIIGDVFHDVVIPYHFLTREYAQLVNARLNPQGIYVLNLVDVPADPILLKSLYKTLASVFRHVAIWSDDLKTEYLRQTFIISANNHQTLPTEHHAQFGPQRYWKDITHQILGSGTALADIPVMTDDYAPVERMTADLVFGEHGL